MPAKNAKPASRVSKKKVTTRRSAGVKDGSLRQVEPAFLFLAVVGMCEFFLNGMPILKNLLGEDLDEAVTTTRYREFVFDLLLNGLRTKSTK